MQLTEHQQEIFYDILDFLEDDFDTSDKCLFGLLCGPAGVGKTYVMKNVVKYIRKEMRQEVLCVAPTHKARKVLEQIVNENSLLKIPTCTVASLLNKTKKHSYVGTSNYKSNGSNKINLFNIFIIDEVSMISDGDVITIKKYARQYNKKILFVGDRFQIPHPTQDFTINDNICEKKDCLVFSKPHNLFELKIVMRQKEDNEIVEYYTKIRENIYKDTTFEKHKGKDVIIYDEPEKFEEKIKEEFKKSITDNNVIVYTNVAVNHYNSLVRNTLGFKKEFEQGEILMGYVNVGFPEHVIENGQVYQVNEIKETSKHVIVTDNKTYTKLCGRVIELQEIYPSLEEEKKYGAINSLFFPDVEEENNYEMIMDLVSRAERVNAQGSTKKDFMYYNNLKSKIIFRVGIYKFGKYIETERSFKEKHPLLFSSIFEVFEESEEGKRKNLKNDLSIKIQEMYPRLLEKRIEDNKVFADTELLADKFQVLEKDLDYGYAITCHKSQGSTIKNVFIDDTNFDIIKDRWNHRMSMTEKRIKEKNQLRYVAYTRAKEKTYSLSV